MTPQRRQFRYPKILTHTKPHSDLLKEYWDKLDDVTEMSESCDLMSHDSSTCSSASSTCSFKVFHMTTRHMIIT